MKNLLISIMVCASTLSSSAQNNNQEQILIFNVNIIDIQAGGVLSSMDVLLRDHIIADIQQHQKKTQIFNGTAVDGTGKFMIPGLWDMHTHTSTIPITRNIFFPLFIANGVTGIRNMKTDCFGTEQPDCFDEGFDDPNPSIYDIKKWREEIQAGTLIGPRIVAGSAMLDGPGPGEPSTPYNPGTVEHALQHARILKERGVDFAKIYNFIPRDAYFAFAEEAKRLGLPFAGHVPEGIKASEASEAGQRSIEHAAFTNVAEECSLREDELRRRLHEELESDDPQIISLWLEMAESYDSVKCAQVYKTFIKNGTWVTPTLVAGEKLPGEIEYDWRKDPRLRYLPREELDYWNKRGEDFDKNFYNSEHSQSLAQFGFDVTLAQHKAGVPLLAGSDAGGVGVFIGFGLHEELEILVSIGLTEIEALRTATLEPARYLESEDTQGTIEVGKVADLVLLDANPLVDISNTQKIHAVFFNGRYFDREALDEMLMEVERAASK